jgi:hypothetical protein
MNPAVITVFTTWEYGKVGRASSVLDQMMDMLGLMRHEQQSWWNGSVLDIVCSAA